MSRGGTAPGPQKGLTPRPPGGKTSSKNTPRKSKIKADDKNEHSMLSWGRGDRWQLGNGATCDRALPVTMMFTKTDIKAVACGSMHTIVLLGPAHAPRVFAWGEGQDGQLGIPKSASMQAMHPVEVKALAPTAAFMVREVGAGGESSFAISNRQELLMWGNNSCEQLGLGSSFRGVDRIFAPTPISPNFDTTEMQWRNLSVRNAVLGRKFGLAIDKFERVYSWGDNSHGQLGVGDRNSRNSPVLIEALQHVRQVAVGQQHSAAIDSRRQLWTWGDCADGRLGHGVLFTEIRSVQGNVISRNRKQVDFLPEPKLVEFFRLSASGREVSLVACGDRFTVALDQRGLAWSWGSGIYGQLGRGSNVMSAPLPGRIAYVPAHGAFSRMSSAHTVAVTDINEEERGHKSHGGPKSDRAGTGSEQVHDSIGAGSIELSRPMQPEQSVSSFNQTSREEAAETCGLTFQTIQAGPYHCVALSDDGRLFCWGKGRRGVLGQGNEQNHYEPVQVQTNGHAVSEPAVKRFSTGEYHSAAVLESDRYKMMNVLNFKMRPVPDSDDLVFIPERELAPEDISARFRADYRPGVSHDSFQGRSTKGQFSNVIDVTEAGKIVLDKGRSWRGVDETEEVDDHVINPARPLSLHRTVHDIKSEWEGIIPNAEQFLGCGGWDLLDEHLTQGSVDISVNLDPLLDQATADEIKSNWGQFAPAVHESGLRRSSTGEAEEEGQRSSTQECPKSVKKGAGEGSGFTNLKKAMAECESENIFDDYHQKVSAQALHFALKAHNRKAHGTGIHQDSFSTRSAIFSRSDRFPAPNDRHALPGPGEYGVNDTHPEWAKTTPAKVLKPAGIGLTLTLRENHAMYSKGVDPRDKGHWDVVVKDIVKDGSVEKGNNDGRSQISVNDVILKINGETFSTLYEARQAMMGSPGTTVTVFYKHKDESGGSVRLNHTFMRRYIGKREDCIGSSAFTQPFPAPGGYTGLGLQAPRWEDPHRDLLSEAQEEAIIKVIHRLQDELTPDNDNLLKTRLAMYPREAMAPGIKRVTEEVQKEFPEWSEDLSRAGAVARVFKKYQYLEPRYSSNLDNPNVGPGAMMPPDHVPAGARRWVAPIKTERDSAEAALKDKRLEAEEIVIGRMLEPGEFERLPPWKKEKLKQVMTMVDKREFGGPGPAQYSPVDPHEIGTPRYNFKPSDTGHHVKGVTICARSTNSKGASTLETPGPNHYNLRRNGLAYVGGLNEKQGSSVVYRPAIRPTESEREPEGEFYAIEMPKGTAASIATRIKWENQFSHEAGLTYDKETGSWMPMVPGPDAYTPKLPDPGLRNRTPRLHGREAIEMEQVRKIKLVDDPASGRKVSDFPGPADYKPVVRKDGTCTETGASVAWHGPTAGVRLEHKKTEFATPGPGHYHIASDFDEDPRRVKLGGLMSMRLPPGAQTADRTPGPGSYPGVCEYDSIGTDLVSIGAAARETHGMSATEAIHSRDAGTHTEVRQVLNYSAMNKAIEKLKTHLGELFDSIYDAFAYFDVDGDWSISESEFRHMLKQLDIDMEQDYLRLVVSRMDTVADGSIDPKEFIQSLRWKREGHKKWKDEVDAMTQSCR